MGLSRRASRRDTGLTDTLIAQPSLADKEDRRLRGTIKQITIGDMFTRVYDVNEDNSSIIPARGDIMPGYDVGSTNPVFAPRVYSLRWIRKPKGDMTALEITFLQPLPY